MPYARCHLDSPPPSSARQPPRSQASPAPNNKVTGSSCGCAFLSTVLPVEDPFLLSCHIAMAVLLSDLLHLQPLSPSHSSDCLYCLAFVGINCRPSLPPTVSLAHTSHPGQIAELVFALQPSTVTDAGEDCLATRPLPLKRQLVAQGSAQRPPHSGIRL